MLLNSVDKNGNVPLAVNQDNQYSIDILYDKYAPALFGIINRIIGNEKVAEKVLQQTFINIGNQITSFNASISSLFSWLISITRKTALEEVKVQQSQNPQRTNTVYPTQQNSAFDLVYYKGLTYKEVAAILKVSVAQVIESIKKNHV